MRRLDRYAITGSLAGPGIAPARLAMIYVDDAERAAEALEVVPAEAGANLWLLGPYDDVVFERTQSLPITPAPEKFTVTAAAPGQVVVDLLTSPEPEATGGGSADPEPHSEIHSGIPLDRKIPCANKRLPEIPTNR